MKQADAIETLAALAAWTRHLAERQTSSGPDKRFAVLERFPDEPADRCSRALRAALHPRCVFIVEGEDLDTSPMGAAELFGLTILAAKKLGTTRAEILRITIDYVARHALEDLEALHSRGTLIDLAHATLRAANDGTGNGALLRVNVTPNLMTTE